MKCSLRRALLGSMLATVAFCVLRQDIPLMGGQVASGETIVPPASQQRATEQITVHAAGRGHPWLNLRDGHDLPTAYTGAGGHAVEQGVTQPLALAAGDFDEDGVPDLVCGYEGPGGGILTPHRGNVDAIYPNSPEAQQRKADGTFTDSPFLSPARVFAVPEVPEFLGVGDFDTDGHLDVVLAYRGKVLYWLAGDGQGGFGPAKHIELPGMVTALVTGEMK